MSEIVRTFIAVEVPPEVKQRALKLIGELQQSSAKVRWVGADAMHWTLKFLGDVELLDTHKICEAVARAVEPLAPFDVEASGAGAFPDVSRPRTVWLGMEQGTERMIELHGRIESELAKLGYRPEGRRFRPHLTIGRVRSAPPRAIEELGRMIQENSNFDGGISTVFEVVVFASELGPDGPTHEPLGHAELKGR
jgi:2'-5' RNA ligase